MGQFHQPAVLEVAGNVADIDLTFAVVGGGTGLAALFWPLYANGTEGRQVFFHPPVDNAGLVDLFLHGSHFNDLTRSLHTAQLNFDLTQFICFGSRTITLCPNFCA